MIDQQGREYRGACDVALGESYFGACDALICGGQAHYYCQLEDCRNNICSRHFERCPACGLIFCNSPDSRLHDCFYLHQVGKDCEHSLVAPVLAQLEKQLDDPRHIQLHNFVTQDADGFGNKLPEEVPANLALASLCLSGKIEDIPHSAKLEQRETQRRIRAAKQREARACQRLGLRVVATRNAYHRVDLYKRSTALIAEAALLTRAFAGSPHYGEQHQLLRLVGVHRQEDFIRDRLNALRNTRPSIYAFLCQRAEDITKRIASGPPQQRSMF
jgi:hypothetical protein